MSNLTDATALVGFQQEPNCGRGTLGILWLCLPTIFLCAWTVYHPDVPNERHSATRKLLYRLGWFFVAIVCPEAICLEAQSHWTDARHIRLHFRESYRINLSRVQASYIVAGGLDLRQGNSSLVIVFEDLPSYMTKLQATNPNGLDGFNRFMEADMPSDEDIADRSKSDALAKTIVGAQALWVLVSIVGRLVESQRISLIEVGTAGYIVVALATYAFWFSKPYNVNTRTVLSLPPHLYVEQEKQGNQSQVYASNSETREWWKCHVSRDTTFLLNRLSILCIFVVVVAGFAAIHASAWHYPFPTPQEATLWRVCSIFQGIIPILAILMSLLLEVLPEWLQLAFWFPCVISYVFARGFLVVEMFISFRAAPAGIYDASTWTNYFGECFGMWEELADAK